ncbi:replication initiator protein [Salmonella enterica]|nr:replication initiator protein [Salmonella enterica]EDZ6123498.1 replication initiator protein [Salmonella enterica]HAG8001614.1 replication initiator protein [Escherichia coli]
MFKKQAYRTIILYIQTDPIKMKISCQLKLIRFTGESAIAFSLLSGQKVNGHIGLPA